VAKAASDTESDGGVTYDPHELGPLNSLRKDVEDRVLLRDALD